MTPKPVCKVDAIRTLERDASDRPLMELAGAAAAGQARLLSPRTADPVVVFIGPGNNGGDGYVVARHLRDWGHRVIIVSIADQAHMPPAAREAYRRWIDSGGGSAGGAAVAEPPSLADCGLIVDALFGIGLARPLGGQYAEWIAAINRADCPVLALDIPSGLDADTGMSSGPVVNATHTATFIALKPGLITGAGVDAAGEVSLHDLDIDATNAIGQGHWIDWPYARRWLKKRGRNTHKGSFGTVAVIGGGNGMVGAALLAGRAALYAGAGKVRLGLSAEAPPGFDYAQPEMMIRAADQALRADMNVIVIGPGLGQSRRESDFLARALHKPVPLVLDADALNLNAVDPALAQRLAHRSHPSLMTPHPAEAARLLQTSTPIIQSDRLAAALKLSEQFNAIVALKGAGTVCAFPNGEWTINATGNPGLATAGSGDVLSGIIGALLAQGYKPEQAMQLGVCVHGAAADVLVAQGTGPVGLVASDLPPAVRRLLNS